MWWEPVYVRIVLHSLIMAPTCKLHHCTTLHFTTLHCTTQKYTTLHYTTPHMFIASDRVLTVRIRRSDDRTMISCDLYCLLLSTALYYPFFSISYVKLEKNRGKNMVKILQDSPD